MNSTRGRTFVGTVIGDKMHKTVTVEWQGKRYVPKYERYAKSRTRVKAHNPEEVNAKVGQVVQIMETRPISKTKNFIVTKVLKEGEAPVSEEYIERTKKKKTKEKAETKNEVKKKEIAEAEEKLDESS